MGKSKTKGYMLRRLTLNCPKHGKLTSGIDDYEPYVFEMLNKKDNKVETKCYLCMELEMKNQRIEKLEKEYLKTRQVFGGKADKLSKRGLNLMGAGLLAAIIVGFVFHWGLAILLGVVSFFIGGLFQNASDEYQKQVSENPYIVSPQMISDLKETVRNRREEVKMWRIEQSKLKKEKVDYSLEDVDKMNGTEFEIFVLQLLKQNGYSSAELTRASGDEGADILAYRNGKKIAIQCKRHSKSITNRAVQEVYAAKAYYNCSEAYVITNSHFTIPAKNLAKKLGVTLFNRDRLFTLIQKTTRM